MCSLLGGQKGKLVMASESWANPLRTTGQLDSGEEPTQGNNKLGHRYSDTSFGCQSALICLEDGAKI